MFELAVFANIFFGAPYLSYSLPKRIFTAINICGKRKAFTVKFRSCTQKITLSLISLFLRIRIT